MLTKLSLWPGALILFGAWTHAHAIEKAPVPDKAPVADSKTVEKPVDMPPPHNKDMDKGAPADHANKDMGKVMPVEHTDKPAGAKSGAVKSQVIKGGAVKGSALRGMSKF